ncbi:ferrochelatase [Desmospora profundinema]|uniref:Coproporphyrin III ferrochelatase n=1 Tax=Desmospora profundinema TaxID=1571184 RepID=A0ABU1IJT0_9BACL|nr:ferrochelatase [Desmospora profundinema]MDR6224409.1 ferrochelatase [Desmospora profundinema]
MTKRTVGLLVMAYGTPRSTEEIEPYYTHIRHGRKPPEELLQDLKDRYEAIGGISPLARITDDQALKLQDRLNELHEEVQFKAYLGLKHIDPFVEDAVRQMHQDGIEEAVSIVLAPHYSTFSIRSYNGRAKEEADKRGGPCLYSVESWYAHPRYVAYWADGIRNIMASLSDEEQKQTCVVFSAHSLPEKIIRVGDPYPQQLEESAQLVAEAAGIENYAVGWQSAGNTPEPWLEPDVQDLTRDLHREKGYTGFIYCPLGFVADHLEVLYDNDYECKIVCDEIGARYHRPPMPNAKPEFIECLADVISQQWAERERA